MDDCMKITKFQRHPTDASCVILHFEGPMFGGAGTTDVVNQAFRAALEAAGKLED